MFGTVELIDSHGAGAGEGPVPIWKPPGTVSLTSWRPGDAASGAGHRPAVEVHLPVPAVRRLRDDGQLVIPEGQWVQFNVTSLDVIHSFWAYQLGVKADANPNVDNVAYAKPTQTGQFTVRCAELCGLWHGAMFDYGTGRDGVAVPVLGGVHQGIHGRCHQAAAALCHDLRPDGDPGVQERPRDEEAGADLGGRRLLPAAGSGPAMSRAVSTAMSRAVSTAFAQAPAEMER